MEASLSGAPSWLLRCGSVLELSKQAAHFSFLNSAQVSIAGIAAQEWAYALSNC
jgi:hypothetical protein